MLPCLMWLAWCVATPTQGCTESDILAWSRLLRWQRDDAGVLQIEKFAEGEVTAVEYELEKDLRSFGKGFTVIEQVRPQPPALAVN